MANQKVYYWDDETSSEDMRAMWADSRVKQQWEFRRDSTGKVPFVMKKLRGEMVPYLTFEEVHAVASILERRHFSSEGKRLFPEGLEGGNDVAAAVSGLARVESSWQLTACRWETREYSTGLMQVLQSTAKSLEVQGYDAYIETAHNSFLYRPFEAMYYGMAYLSYLSHYKGIPHSEESVVRGYNGGPRGIYKPATEPYWNKYLQAKEELRPMIRSSVISPREVEVSFPSSSHSRVIPHVHVAMASRKNFGFSVGFRIPL